MRYEVQVTHEELYSIVQVVFIDGETETVVMGWDTESNPNAGWLAQDCCDRFNAEKWGKFTAHMLPVHGVMWHRFDSQAEGEAFAEWAEYITKDDPNPCEAFLMGSGEDGKWEVKVRNW